MPEESMYDENVEEGMPNKIEKNENSEKELTEDEILSELVALERNVTNGPTDKESPRDIEFLDATAYNKIRDEIMEKLSNYRPGGRYSNFYDWYWFFRIGEERGNHKWSDFLADDKELLLKAGKFLPGPAMENASDKLRDDKEFVEKLLEHSSSNNTVEILAKASERLQDDEELVRKAIKRYAWAIISASERLKNNLNLVLFAAKVNPEILSDKVYGHGDEARPIIGEEVRKKLDKILGRIKGYEDNEKANKLIKEKLSE